MTRLKRWGAWLRRKMTPTQEQAEVLATIKFPCC